jgi:transposase
MAGDELFDELPQQVRSVGADEPRGAPRLREPNRDRIELRPVALESLIGEDHLARVIWAYVIALDLSELENQIKAREGRPGRPRITPQLLLALWLYATSQGVGSARALARLCEGHDAYRWLCGGVPVNYHTLADFRVGCADLLDRLLSEHLASLAQAGVIDLDELVQDGMRIRANAGASSFRRQETLDRHLATAQTVVQELKREVEAKSDNSSQRAKAAKERAAREREERVKKAQAAAAEIKRKREELASRERGGNGQKPKEPRASTTDPQARVMKTADGGFRPGYNVQVVSAAGEQIVVAIDVSNNGSDGGQMRPMLERLQALSGRLPKRHIVDGGFSSAEDIEWAHSQNVEVYCPPKQGKTGTDPYAPRPGDGDGVAAWRVRMGTDEGKALYQLRTICECIHARWRNWNLRQVTVRGIAKVRAVVLWYAFTNNLLQGRLLTSAS